MFESDFVDSFSRVSWWAVPIIYVPVIVGLFSFGLGAAGTVGSVLAAAAGLFVWTFAEYWLHRTLFHWVPNRRWGPRFHFLLHGVHHEWVNDRFRLVMPPMASGALAVVFFGMWYLALGPVWVYPFFAGHVLGYLGYDMTHYYIHHGKPRSSWMKQLRAHHMNHHHNQDRRRFGVSTRVWDRVFGTL